MSTGLKCLKFYENWWAMAESRDTDEKRLAFYDSIMRYAFAGVIPKPPQKGVSHGTDWAAWDGFNVCRPMIDGVVDTLITHDNKVIAGRLGGVKSGENRRKSSFLKNNDTNEAKIEAEIEADREAEIEAESDSLIKDKDKEKEKDNNKDNNGGSGVPTNDEKVMFESWWKSYPGPRKQDKKKCLEKFTRILRKSKDEVSMFNKIMNGLDLWKKCDTWTRDNGKYIRAPMVWLNNENWNDTPGSTPLTSSVANVHHSETAEVEDAF